MNLNNENEQLSQKVANFLNAHIKVILYCVLGLLVIGIAIFLTMHFKDKARKTTLAGIERIVYDLEDFKTKNKVGKEDSKKNNEEAKDEESSKNVDSEKDEKVDPKIVAKEDSAIKDLQDLVGSSASGYVGFRANTVIAEIYFARKNYKEALKFYELASKADDSHYIAGIAFFNVATCADELGDKEKAAKFYKKASEVEAFPLIPRALFNLARMNESLGKKDEAIAAYKKILEKYPRNEWAFLGKSRLIELEK